MRTLVRLPARKRNARAKPKFAQPAGRRDNPVAPTSLRVVTLRDRKCQIVSRTFVYQGLRLVRIFENSCQPATPNDRVRLVLVCLVCLYVSVLSPETIAGTRFIASASGSRLS